MNSSSDKIDDEASTATATASLLNTITPKNGSQFKLVKSASSSVTRSPPSPVSSLSVSPNSSSHSSKQLEQHRMLIVNCVDDRIYISGQTHLIKSVLPEIKDDMFVASKAKPSEPAASSNSTGATSTTNDESETTTTTANVTKPDQTESPRESQDYQTRLCLSDLHIGITHFVHLMERLYDNSFALEAHYGDKSKNTPTKTSESSNSNCPQNYEYIFIKCK